MMRWIIISSLRIRLVVVAIGILIIFFGVMQLSKTPFDILPEFSRPYVQIHTEALGLSANEVEALITTPLEADMLNGVAWVDEIRSESIPGLSSIVLIFEPGTDIMAARQMVQERLVSVFALPNVSKAPVMLNPMSSSSRCMMVGFKAKQLSKIEMSVLARWTVLPRLLGVPGVANVAIWGYRDRQLQVQIDPKQLEEKGVSLSQIISTTGNALWVSPLSFLSASTPGTGGFFDTPNQRIGIRHILPITNPDQLSKVIVEGSSIPLGDVSDIVEEHQPLIGDALIDENPNLILVVEKFPWANTVDVTRGVEDALRELQPGLAGVEINSTLFRPATYLGVAVENLTQAFLFVGILILLSLISFFINWRMTLISVFTIILSVITAVGILYLEGITLNMMIIAGLIIALGAIIDDSVIDIENIKNRIIKEREKGNGKNIATTIYEASIEMRTPIIYATLIIILIVLPVFFLKGISGSFYQSIALSYILAIVASFVVAMTVTPTLTFLLFRNASLQKPMNSTITKILQRLYGAVFSKVSKSSRPVFITVCALVIVGIIAVMFFRQESLVPGFKENDLMVRWDAPPGTSHLEMNRILSLAGNELGEIEGVRAVSSLVGRAVMSDMVKNVNAGQLWISVKPEGDYDRIVNEIKSVVSGYPGFFQEVLTYSQSKVREELSGTDEALVVRVFGEDLDIIKSKAEELQKGIAKIDGIVDSKVLYPEIEPTLEIEVDLDLVQKYGLKPGDVRRQATSLVSGLAVGNLFEEQKVFDVVVWGKPNIRYSLSSIQNLLIETPTGSHIPLKELADIRIVPNMTNIKRESVARYIDITASINGRNLSSVVNDVKSNIKGTEFPLEYRAELLGEFAERVNAKEHLQIYVVVALILIFLLLQASFRSWKLALAIFLTLPMALVGGILSNYLVFGNTLSLGSLIGFVTVFGFTMRSTITLIHRYRHLEKNEDETFSLALIEKGTRERFLPIIISTITILLAFIPMVIFGQIAGLEIAFSIAVIVLGGILTSALYTLIAVPVVYTLFGNDHEPDLELSADVPVFEE
jgi:CzcA family heavy metal efflux pump